MVHIALLWSAGIVAIAILSTLHCAAVQDSALSRLPSLRMFVDRPNEGEEEETFV